MYRSFFLVAILLAIFKGAIGTHATVESAHRADSLIVRLPSGVAPIHCSLRIKVNLPGYATVIPRGDELTTSGEVECLLNVTEETNVIQFHTSSILTITSVAFSAIDATTDTDDYLDYTDSLSEDKENMLANVSFPETLQPGTFSIKVIFTGWIMKSLPGLYYTINDGENGTEYAAVTHLEPTWARRMFPCFDEPALKATWDITVIHPVGTHALSNAELEETSEEDGFVVSSFAKTPLISTYLLSIVVSNFENISQRMEDGRVIRGFFHSSLINHSTTIATAINLTIKTIEYLEQTFGIRANDKKLDFVVDKNLPGGMENWGLIAYRADVLNISDEAVHPVFLETIVHEMTHQWIGNLVTLAWWDDLWLNEGLTTFISYFVQQHLNATKEVTFYHELRLEKSFRGNEDAMKLDRTTKANLRRVFTVVYNKGCAFAHMLHEMMGHKNFFQGIKSFIHKFAYKSVTTEDFLETIQQHTNVVNLTSFAGPWLRQIGYPVVMVNRISNNTFRLTQEGFPPIDHDERKWDIPMFSHNIVEGNALILGRDEGSMIVSTLDGSFPIINSLAAGAYRVDYGPKGWKEIVENERGGLMKVPKRFLRKMLHDITHTSFHNSTGNFSDETHTFAKIARAARFL